MSIFEIQVVRGGRWMADDAFEDIDAAYECAARIERKRKPEQLRIRRLDMIRPGFTRERTVYDGGLKIHREKAAEKDRQEQEAIRQRVEDRRVRSAMANNTARKNNSLFSSSSPVYLTLVTLSIGLTGLSAMYLVEKAFTS